MKKYVKYSFLIFVFICCKNDKTDDFCNENYNKVEEITKNLKLKNKNIPVWNDLNFSFTYKYDSILEYGKQIIKSPFLTDIKIKDNLAFISLNVVNSNSFYFELKLDNLNDLKKIIEYEEREKCHMMNCALIVQINKIQKLGFALKPHTDKYENDIYNYIEIGDNNTYLGYGKILEIKFTN